MTSSISEIEAELSRSRAALRENLSALADRLTVKHVIGDVVLTPGFLAGAAKVAVPFVLAGAAGVLLARAGRAASQGALPGRSSSRASALSSLIARIRLRPRDTSTRTLLLAAAAVALAGGAAAALPLTGREKRVLSRPMRLAAEQAAGVGRSVAREAQSLSDQAAAFARKASRTRTPALVERRGPSPTIVSAS